MFLELDKKNRKDIAVIDDNGLSMSYGDICDFSSVFAQYIPKRKLIFIFAENTIGSLLGYLSSMINRIVPLIISAKSDFDLYTNLMDKYMPEYLWVPDWMAQSYDYRVVFSKYGYSLLKTEFSSCPLYDDLALLLPTSGSTGSPKLVRHSYKNIEANAFNVLRMFQLTRHEKAMAILPMHYTMGLSVITSHLLAGASLLLSNYSLLNKKFWERLKDATSFTGVPYSFELMMKMNFTKMNFPNLKIITQGGGKLTPELFHKLAVYAQENGKQFIPTYGQSECTARMAYLPSYLTMVKTCSIGFAEPGGRLSIIDDEGNETYSGEAVGEMIYRGENVTLGYANCVSDLIKGDENYGVMHTGDLARRDTDGCYYIVGRLKRFLKIYGLRVGLDEVELMVKSAFHTDCICSGNDEILNVKVTNKSILNEVIDFISQKTHLFHHSINVEYVESIKRNETGKIILSK